MEHQEMGWENIYFSRSSKLNYILNLMAHPMDFGHNVFFPIGGELVNKFLKLSNSPWEPHRNYPLGVNIDRCITYNTGRVFITM